jgi:hypothetical protein
MRANSLDISERSHYLVVRGEQSEMKLLIFLFAAGCLSLWLADYSFPITEQTKFLVGMFTLWFVGVAILGWAKKNGDGNNFDSHSLTKLYYLIVFIPWIVCAALVANALMDSSTPIAHMTSVTTRFTGKSGPSVSVRSWSSTGKTIRIPVDGGCYNRLSLGENVTVMEQHGALGMLWISSIAECPHR